MTFFANTSSSGELSFAPDNLIVNEALSERQHKDYDVALLRVVRERLNGVQDLLDRGLRRQLPNIGISLAMYEVASDLTAASISMDGRQSGDNDAVRTKERAVPVPIFYKDWNLSMRQIAAGESNGNALSNATLEIAGRQVANSLENALFNGVPSIQVGSLGNVYGYTNHPNRGTLSLSGGGTKWLGTNADIIGDVEKLLALAYTAKRSSPYVLYVASNVYVAIQGDYKTAVSRTFRDRILDFVDIESVKPSAFLPDNNVVLVSMTSDSVELAVGRDIVNEQFQSNLNQVSFRVYTIATPIIKQDFNDSVGVFHGA